MVQLLCVHTSGIKLPVEANMLEKKKKIREPTILDLQNLVCVGRIKVCLCVQEMCIGLR